MKPRNSRSTAEPASSGRTKTEALNTNGPAATQQTSAQAIRKRRSSINVYDQPSSLNARLRQLETDMLRLDEDRSKLFDDTHSSLAQFEIRLNEIQSILKSRQDNVEKYVEEMKLLLAAKEEFEKQSKLLNEKHERMQDKFMHRETTISRDIRLLKTKFELLEKNRQFRSVLQQCKSNDKTGDTGSTHDTNNGLNDSRSGSHDGGAMRKARESSCVGLDPIAGLDGSENSKVPPIDQDAKMMKKKKKISRSKKGFVGRMLRSLGKPFEWLSLGRLWPTSRIIPKRVADMRHDLTNNRVSSIITVSNVPDDDESQHNDSKDVATPDPSPLINEQPDTPVKQQQQAEQSNQQSEPAITT